MTKIKNEERERDQKLMWLYSMLTALLRSYSATQTHLLNIINNYSINRNVHIMCVGCPVVSDWKPVGGEPASRPVCCDRLRLIDDPKAGKQDTKTGRILSLHWAMM